ncbi:MAG: hypothetical protein R3B46_08950 [Phycisphaerales bacterium]
MPIRSLIAGAVVLVAASLCRADLPDIVDAIPADARAAVVIPSVNEFDGAVTQLLIAMEQGEASSPKQLLRIVGIAGAIDARRPIAAFYRTQNDSPMLAALVPTLNAKKAMESLGATKGAGGNDNIWSFEAGSRTWFVRALTDNDLLVGLEPRSLAAYTPVTGQLDAHKAAMGDAGLAATQNANIIAWGEMDEFRPMLDQWLAKAGSSINALKAGLGNTTAPGADELASFVDTLTHAITRDADRFTLTARTDANGVVAQFASSFTPDSQMHRAATASRPAEPRELFAGLPALPYLLALSVDASHEGVRAIAATSANATGDRPTALHTAEALALAAYEPPGMLVMEGGLSRVVLHFAAEKPDTTARWFKSYIKSLDGTQGASVSYDDATGQVAGVSIDRWVMSIPDTGNRSAQLLYGQHGTPRGVVALREHDGYITSAPDDLITNILKGRAAGSLASNAQIKELASWLPADPAAQGFLNFRPMLMQAMPMLAMMGINIDVPLRLPPIAASISMHDGQAHAGAFVPAYAIKLAWQFYKANQAMNAPPPEPQPRPGVNPSRGGDGQNQK